MTSRAERAKPAAGVQTVVRALSILDAIAGRSTGISLSDLSRCVGLHKSTTFRIVETMVTLGYVAKLERAKLYRIGERMPRSRQGQGSD